MPNISSDYAKSCLMKRIEKKAVEYADVAVDDPTMGTELEGIGFFFNRENLQDAFEAGAEWMRAELCRWHNPNKEFPNPRQKVLVMATHDPYGNSRDYFVASRHKDGVWIVEALPKNYEIIAWREIL